MDLISTLPGSYLEDFFPRGWNLRKMDACCTLGLDGVTAREPFWNRQFEPVACNALSDLEVFLGHEIAMTIRNAREAGRQLVLILPVGPMGMYRWVVFFLRSWQVRCDHVHGFNMDEWADGSGDTLPADDPGAFCNAMRNAFYEPLGELTVPEKQRHFATRGELPEYAAQIAELKAGGAEVVTIYGIGRVCHIAFWEPHFAGEFSSADEWKAQTHRLAAKLHPLTIEQNAQTSFKSRTTLVPCRANTIGPALFLQSDRMIGGADGVYGRGMQWQGFSLCVTLKHGPDIWIPSSFVPTLPGKLFFLSELAGPLQPEMN